MKMSNYCIKELDIDAMVNNAYETMGRMFAFDRYQLSRDETIGIFKESYK